MQTSFIDKPTYVYISHTEKMTENESAPAKRPRRAPAKVLDVLYMPTDSTLTPPKVQIGVDEAGRGPLFGRVYAAAVKLPTAEQAPDFHPEWLKDSKKFTSEKKLAEVAAHIKQYCIWSVAYCTEQMIDKINIRQATHQAMQTAIKDVLSRCDVARQRVEQEVLALIDGNDFRPITMILDGGLCPIPYVTVEGGDDKYAAIAAASILAKHARDTYIYELVTSHPWLDQRYGLASNKGYGSKNHLAGIREFGISVYHRRTFGCCATAPLNDGDA
jgi:ribonuclease HII